MRKSSGADAVEIDFVIQQKHLSDAGYNVLAYDIGNHGTSSAANGGISGGGTAWESKSTWTATRRSAK